MAGNLADVITCAKFQDDIFRGYNFTESRISHFSIDFCMGLTTVQRYCTACDHLTIKCTTKELNILIYRTPFYVVMYKSYRLLKMV